MGRLASILPMQGTTEELISVVDKHLQDDKLQKLGDHVVIMGGLPVASHARTNFVKLHRVGGGW